MNLPLFVVLFPLTWIAWNAYVAWRASSVPALARVPRWLFVAVPLVIAGTWPAARFFEHRSLDAAAWPFEFVAGNALGILFYLCCCLGVVDLATGFGRFHERHVGRLRGAALVAGLLLSVAGFVQGLRAPVVDDVEVTLPGLPPERDGTVLAVASDLHLGTLIGAEWLESFVGQVEAMRPDAILLVGDVVEGDGPLDGDRTFLPLLSRLRAPMGVYAVTGNHEVHAPPQEIARFFADAGITLLEDRWAQAAPGLVVAGVGDSHRRIRSDADLPRIRGALAGRPAEAGAVFLSHRPEHVGTAAAAGAGLMLSGHTHGGQVWPFTYVAAIWHPYIEGRYEVDGMPLVVTRGAGTWGPRMRLWEPGEILRVTLRSPAPR